MGGRDVLGECRASCSVLERRGFCRVVIPAGGVPAGLGRK